MYHLHHSLIKEWKIRKPQKPAQIWAPFFQHIKRCLLQKKNKDSWNVHHGIKYFYLWWSRWRKTWIGTSDRLADVTRETSQHVWRINLTLWTPERRIQQQITCESLEFDHPVLQFSAAWLKCPWVRYWTFGFSLGFKTETFQWQLDWGKTKRYSKVWGSFCYNT